MQVPSTGWRVSDVGNRRVSPSWARYLYSWCCTCLLMNLFTPLFKKYVGEQPAQRAETQRPQPSCWNSMEKHFQSLWNPTKRKCSKKPTSRPSVRVLKGGMRFQAPTQTRREGQGLPHSGTQLTAPSPGAWLAAPLSSHVSWGKRRHPAWVHTEHTEQATEKS